MYKDDKKLIVVTGISGSGKSTLAERIADVMDLEILSVDRYREEAFDRYGFNSLYERHIISELGKATFKAELILKMKSGKSLIVEHPFDISWQEYFDFVSKFSGYSLVIVNCESRDFESIWEDKFQRDNSTERHRAHSADRYIKDKLYARSPYLYSKEKKAEEEKAYKEKVYTSLTGDVVLSDLSIYGILNSGVEE